MVRGCGGRGHGARRRAARQRLLARLCCIAAVLTACNAEPALRGNVVGLPMPAPEIRGANWNGEPFALSELRGRVSIVFFGYTSCPDICPFTLAKLAQLKQELEVGAAELAVVLASVDPPRDSIARLAEYVASFDPEFFGVRLEPEPLSAVTGAYFVGAFANEPSEPGGYYTVDHTGTLFVVDREGMLRVRIGQDAPIEDIRFDVEQLLAIGAEAAPPPARAAGTEAGAAAGDVEIADAVSHPSAGSSVGAVYLVAHNRTAAPERLLGVRSAAAERAELHETLAEDGVMRMEHRPEGFPLPPGARLVLEPGGRHVMLMGLREPLRAGDRIELTLVFERAGEIRLEVPVTPRAAR